MLQLFCFSAGITPSVDDSTLCANDGIGKAIVGGKRGSSGHRVFTVRLRATLPYSERLRRGAAATRTASQIGNNRDLLERLTLAALAVLPSSPDPRSRTCHPRRLTRRRRTHSRRSASIPRSSFPSHANSGTWGKNGTPIMQACSLASSPSSPKHYRLMSGAPPIHPASPRTRGI